MGTKKSLMELDWLRAKKTVIGERGSVHGERGGVQKIRVNFKWRFQNKFACFPGLKFVWILSGVFNTKKNSSWEFRKLGVNRDFSDKVWNL